jgi:hypothetical protein
MKTLAFTIFLLLQTQPAWLDKTPEERFAFLETRVKPILMKHPEVSLRFYDSEFYNSRVTDVAMLETVNLGAYNALVEDLRETPFWGTYFDVVEIIPAVENAYADHYEKEPIQEQGDAQP